MANGFNELMRVDNNGELQLQGRAKKFKFAAVIATEHLRTRKYLEALALGWPCISSQFIIDCVGDPDVRRDWRHYVLSAGVSNALGNAHVAADIHVFSSGWSNNWSLEEQFRSRRRILHHIELPVYLVEHKTLSEVIIGSKPVSELKIEPQTPCDGALCETYQMILLMMGCDPGLIHLVRTLSDFKKFESVDTSKTGVIVIHMQLQSGASVVNRRRSSTGKSKGPCPKLLRVFDSTENSELRRKLLKGYHVTGLIQYHQEWLVQSLINGRLI